MQTDKARVEQVIICQIATNPTNCSKKLLQVFSTSGELIAVDPEYNSELIRQLEFEICKYREQQEKIAQQQKEMNTELSAVKIKLLDLRDKGLTSFFPILNLAKQRIFSLKRKATQKQKKLIQEAEKLLCEMNKIGGNYSVESR